MKGDGGAIGLTQNPDLLLRCMVAGPELARILSEFESSINPQRNPNADACHHEQTNAIQASFTEQALSMVDVIEDMGNPFQDDGGLLYALDTKQVADDEAVATVNSIELTGQVQYEEYIEARLAGEQPISDPIKKNNLSIFARRKVRQTGKDQQKISCLKNDCALFSRLYIACQTRDGNLEEFFKYENQPFPPSLSQNGSLRSGKKSDLVAILEAEADSVSQLPECDAVILDGAVIVHLIRPTNCKTFRDYALQKIVPYIESQLVHVARLDIVWDIYTEHSLKSQTRLQRGQGIRRVVTDDTCIPHNWQEFLKDDKNKSSLFQLLAGHVSRIPTDKLVITTHKADVLTNQQCDMSSLAPCTHEEAGTRLYVHTADAIKQGLHRIMIRTVDTDVVVLAVSVIPQLDVTELWVAFGTGRHFRYIPTHLIALSLGPMKSKVLPLFHAYTGWTLCHSLATEGRGRRGMCGKPMTISQRHCTQ